MFRRLKIKRALHDAKITKLAYQRMMYRIEHTMATMTVTMFDDLMSEVREIAERARGEQI